MICLDTNHLIFALVAGSDEARRLLAWADAGERFCTSALAWYEFTCGPATAEQVAVVRNLLDEILPCDAASAEAAARLFNATGRRRNLRVDALIAASAIIRRVQLATRNRQEFSVFQAHGLRLAD